MPLTDSELCLLNNVLYNDKVYKQMQEKFSQGEEITLEALLEKAAPDKGTTGALISDEEWYALVDKITSDAALKNLRLYDVDTNTALGSRNVCFVDASGNPYVVMKGTGHGSKARGDNEWGDNVDGLAQSDTDQQLEAKAYVEYLYRKTGKKLTVSGHSKGGNKAMYCTVTTDYIARCVTIDGQGFNGDFCKLNADAIAAKKDLMINYHPESDFVNCLLRPIAGKDVYISSSRIGVHYAKNHSPIAVLDGDMELGPEGKQSRASKEINDFSLWLDENVLPEDKPAIADAVGTFVSTLLGSHEDLRAALQAACEADPEGMALFLAYVLEYPDCDDLLTSVLSEVLGTPITSLTDSDLDALINGGFDVGIRGFIGFLFGPTPVLTFKGTQLSAAAIMHLRKRIRNKGRGERPTSPLQSNLIHDFSEAKLQELLDIIQEIDAEPWYDVSHWDIWYRGEHFLGRLNIDYYQSDIKTYYRKTLDMSDSSAQDICNRFRQAKDMDMSFQQQMRMITDDISRTRTQIDDFSYGV